VSSLGWIPTPPPGETARPYDRYLAGETLSVGGPDRRCPGLDDLVSRARSRMGASNDPTLLDALGRNARRLGAPSASLDTVDALRDGRAVLVFAGQQPALAGGPLYTLHKAATAVAAARALRERDVEARPAFWIPGDDADLHEAGTAYAPGPDRGLVKHTLDVASIPDGAVVGDLASSHDRAAIDALFPDPGEGLRRLVDSLHPADGDLGDALARLLLHLFGGEGLLVVDGRWPEVRAAAGPLLGRYREHHQEVARRVDAAGDRLDADGVGRAVHPTSAAAPLFVLEDGIRRKLEAGEWPEDPATISPGVLLRSFVQESILPTAGMVVGPGELAYLLQTEVVAELLGVTRSPFIPRLDATWLDATLVGLVPDEEGAPRWTSLFEDPGALVEASLRDRIAPDARAALERLGRTVGDEVTGLVAAVDDRGFEQFAGAALNKIRFQIQRTEEQLLDRERRAAKKRGELLVNVGDVVRPRRGPQDRTLSMLWPIAVLGPDRVRDRVLDAAADHLVRLGEARPAHAILSLDDDPDPEPGSDKEAPWPRSFGSV